MSFVMFATWVLVGVLAGVLAERVMKRGGHGLKTDVTLGLVGSIGGSILARALIYAPTGMIPAAIVACIGAAIPLVAQRQFWPTDAVAQEKGAMWKWGFGAALVAAMLWMNLAPAKPPAATAAVIEDKSYAVTPPSLKLKAGLVSGEVVDMKVTERVEKGSDRVVAQAKLTGILRLKNTSSNQTVRLVGGKIVYVDAQGQPIKLEDTRTEPTVKFSSSSNLDPGQETTESMDVEFPADALTAGRLKEIRVDLAYITSPYHEDTLRIPVSIGGRP
ncbi:MAG TPA: hypothetical protein VFW70_22675 [Methylomirabilota bacterium]|jgi:uncharacterized membrane protein YeaQ/YmgE (transglycosylase-associated protein family)|nr:hypothetical protein [Methylomirabilota bacterium]